MDEGGGACALGGRGRAGGATPLVVAGDTATAVAGGVFGGGEGAWAGERGEVGGEERREEGKWMMFTLTSSLSDVVESEEWVSEGVRWRDASLGRSWRRSDIAR